MKKNQVLEFKIDTLASGDKVVVKVFKSGKRKSKVDVKIRGRQTSDFALIGRWKRNPFKF